MFGVKRGRTLSCPRKGFTMRRQRSTPGVECVEARDLPSGIMATLAAGHPSPPSALAMVQQISFSGDPPPYVPGPGDPLPRELAHERFRATFSGPLFVRPPLFTGQSKILFFQGTGTSNQFRHGDYQMAIILPRNPNDPITGGAYLQDRNINSSGAIAFDLEADPKSLDRWGRPTRLTFSINSNIFSGIYYDPQASGTVQIRYGKNSASVLFQGLIFASGITNPLRNSNLY